MKSLKLLGKGLLLCALVAVVATGCTQRTELQEEPAANQTTPGIEEQARTTTGEQPTTDQTQSTGEQPAGTSEQTGGQ